MPNKYLIILMTVVMLSATEIYAQIKDCTECATRELTSQDIEGKSLEEVAMLRNEIFARHGYRFGDGRYRAYFEVQEWYEPAASNKDIRLSATEKKNVAFLQRNEEKLQQIRSRALADVKRLKDELNGTKTAFTENLLKEIARVERLNGMEETLRSILNKLNLNEIHWNKGKGNYSVQIDNGYCISYYGIYFSGDQMTVSMSEPMAHSEIFGNYEDGYSDYMSESESTIWFVFRMTYGGIVFEHIKTAG